MPKKSTKMLAGTADVATLAKRPALKTKGPFQELLQVEAWQMGIVNSPLLVTSLQKKFHCSLADLDGLVAGTHEIRLKA